MRLTINLPLLKIDGTFSDDTIRYGKDGRIELWHTKIMKALAENIKAAGEFFFQDNLEIDEPFFNSIGMNSLDMTFEFARVMFNNLQKVLALQEHLEVRFDEITAVSERDMFFHIYEVDGTEYSVFYDRDLMAYATELEQETLRNSSMQDIMGQISYVEDYFEVIDIKKTAQKIRNKINMDKFKDELTDNIYNDDKKLILWLSEEDEYFLADILYETFDFDKFAKTAIEDPETAITKIDGLAGEYIYNTEISAKGYVTLPVTIFRMY